MNRSTALPSVSARSPAWRRVLRPAAWVLAAAVLALTFSAYLDPHMTRDLADMVWACFG
jgi:ferric-dicitrate binding protein FerR (iron transport regulator)